MVSFRKLLNRYRTFITSDNTLLADKASRILKIAEQHPVLENGFTDASYFTTHKSEIKNILEDVFSPLLTFNEIKTASIPFQDITFNTSERFKSIIKKAGADFELKIKNLPTDQRYIVGCTMILSFCYGYDVNFRRPFLYEIPDENGIIRYYKILYNADFTDITPNSNAPEITRQDYEELLDNFENIDIWKQKFPPHSYTFKGFVISNIFDVTDDQSISNIKSTLINIDKSDKHGFVSDFRSVFQSLLGLKNIDVGFTVYNKFENKFERVFGSSMHSFLLNNDDSTNCNERLCSWSYDRLLKEKKHFSISDVHKLYNQDNGHAPHIKALNNQGVKSAIFSPISNKENEVLGLLEIISKDVLVLNSINANKLLDVMPFIVSAVQRSKEEEENRIQAIIQNECTSIHPSVHWKFVKEAKQFIVDEFSGKKPVFNKVAFNNVYPLYGQIDVKGSSEARNLATQQDLILQLTEIKKIIEKSIKLENLPIYKQLLFKIEYYLKALKQDFKVDSEANVRAFINDCIVPIFQKLKSKQELQADFDTYINSLDSSTGTLYLHRKQYDETIALINAEMACFLDAKQVVAQTIYPHYYERYKTDGVEHNLYIGDSIAKEESFNPIYLNNLRLWQLQVMCEMEQRYYKLKKASKFAIQLDVASLVLVFGQPLSISYRMDEKQFDVDGTYNARY